MVVGDRLCPLCYLTGRDTATDIYLIMSFSISVNQMDEESDQNRTRGNEDRETLHEYVGGWNSNPKKKSETGESTGNSSSDAGSRSER
jgi:hypothetical protein